MLAFENSFSDIFPAQLITHVPYAVIAAPVGNILVVIYKVHGAEYDVIMDMPPVNVRRQNIFMLSLCYRVGKLPPDFMGFLIIYFPRLKGLHQMVG